MDVPITDSRFVAVEGSAADVERIVAEHGHEAADYVLSGLPFSTLPDGVGPAIAAATYRIIRPEGRWHMASVLEKSASRPLTRPVRHAKPQPAKSKATA